MNSIQKAKQAAGQRAADFIQSGMIVGLGTGTTTAFFIESLIEKCQNGLKIQAVATSDRSLQQAAAGGIPLIDLNSVSTLDIVVDGADEIDSQLRMIKGGGGALLREKIVASSGQMMIVIVDETKVVDHLGRFPLPVEILPFGYRSTLTKIQSLGYTPILRKGVDGNVYITDNKNYICDIHFSSTLKNPEKDDDCLKQIPGVLETGFFFHFAKKVIIGYEDGHTQIKETF